MVSAPEDMLALQIRAAKLPEPEREAVLIAGRRFRWDFAWRAHKVCAEVQGGIWGKGAHSSGLGLLRDYEKANLAALAGYRQLFFAPSQIREGTALAWLERALQEGACPP